ncbi:NAD(P)-dependent oxidoreductase [Brevundimonas sp.]|uniref:NAD(P)-dependent oxidoreductase n=1 Tax=Brevundimonas sp. TaxID=1871086 RepID=UPI0028A0B0CC|nr:NAD(P)-dependent oxidoreductase [Brevundimonas sp.]
MKVTVIGASGRAGSEITRELARRGHQVTGVARNPARIPTGAGITAVSGDANDAATLPSLLKGADAVVSAIMFVDANPETLIGAVKAAGAPRYLVVGGAGSLEAAPGLKVIDTPDFPDIYKAEAAAGGRFLDRLRQEDDLDWTFLSPSAVFDGSERTGQFRLGGDALLVGADGHSAISFPDYAIAMADEIETPKHSRRRFTVGY